MFGLAAVSALLLLLAGVLFVAGISTLIFAPLVASRAAVSTSRPKLARRASGDERMRALIHSQITERRRRAGLSVTLTQAGLGLAIAAVVFLIAGIVALLAGY